MLKALLWPEYPPLYQQFPALVRCILRRTNIQPLARLAAVQHTLFQTDIRLQHFWQPKSGKYYRVLLDETYQMQAP